MLTEEQAIELIADNSIPPEPKQVMFSRHVLICISVAGNELQWDVIGKYGCVEKTGRSKSYEDAVKCAYNAAVTC